MKVVPNTFTGWRKLREKVSDAEQQRLYPVVPSRFVDFCESDEDMDLMPVGSLQKTTRKTKLFFTSYPRLQHVEDFVKELRKNGKLRTKRSSASFGFSTNSIQDRLFKRLYVDEPMDQEWFQKNDEFIQNLSIQEKFALVAMTNKSQQHVQAYIRGSISPEFRARVRKWNTRVYGFMPIFFQVADMVHDMSYEDIIEKVCPILTNEQIDTCVGQLCEEVRRIFHKAPPTTRRMVLLRGIHSTDFKRSVRGFVSLTLNPEQALVYAGKQCCLQRVVVLPRTRMLFLGGLSSFPDDLECLLSDSTQFHDLGKKQEIIPMTGKMDTLCPSSKSTRRMTIHDLVAL